MPIAFLMPALSPTMEEGNLVKWNKKEGDAIKPGDVILEIETDKAVMEVESIESGTIGKIIIADGAQAVKVGSTIAIFLKSGEDKSQIEAFLAKQNSTAKPQAVANTQTVEAPVNNATSHSVSANNNASRISVSPLAKRIAKENGVDISDIKGSGPNGRIIKDDILSIGQSKPASTMEYANGKTIKPHSSMRKVIAKRLAESKQTIPHFYLTVDVCIDGLLKVRTQINEFLHNDGAKVSINDFVIKASAAALAKHKDVNASWSDEGMIMYEAVDVSIAVGIPDGLITPIIKHANTKNITIISGEMKSLAKSAKEGTLKPHEFQGGTFTISNLGMYEIKEFNAIINPPQSAILAVGAAFEVPAICSKTNSLYAKNIMSLTLSCDHRVVDGVLGAKFLGSIKSFLENPSLMLAI